MKVQLLGPLCTVLKTSDFVCVDLPFVLIFTFGRINTSSRDKVLSVGKVQSALDFSRFSACHNNERHGTLQ
jgi:hypothetical protein